MKNLRLVLYSTSFLLIIISVCGCGSAEPIEITRKVVVTQEVPVTEMVTVVVMQDVPMTVEVTQEIKGTVQAMVQQTVEAWPTQTPIPTPTRTQQPTRTLTPTPPPFRWKDKVDDPLGQMVTDTDEVTGITWYNHKDDPVSHRTNWIGLYIAERDEEQFLRISINYYASDWLFIEHYLIKADDRTYRIPTSYGEVESDHSGGKIWEWYDERLTAQHLAIVEAIVQADDVTLRYYGDQYYDEKQVTETEKNAMLVTLAAFEELGGNLNDLP